MKDEESYILIRCIGCVKDICLISCAKTALAYTRGDILVNMEKCGDCRQAKRNGIPECVESCSYSDQKAVLTITGVEEKRVQAVSALRFL